MNNRLLVVSDIDGALVDHPYLSSATFERRERDCRRMISLLRSHHVCLSTGRPRHYYESFQKTYAGEAVYPWCLVAEFGSEVLVDGKLVVTKPPDPLLTELERAVRRWAVRRGGIKIDEDPSEESVEGLCFEIKRQILDIDWNFGDPRRDESFPAELRELLERIVDPSQLRYDVYPEIRRIIVRSAGFQPKVSIWPEIKPILGNPATIWVFGDEKLDVAMFHALKRVFNESEVLFGATHPRVKGDANLTCGQETIDFITKLLSA